MASRPRRQRKGDRLLNPGTAPSPEAIRCDYAVAPMDRFATEMDRKWGVDRLPELVSPATAEKYGGAIAKLNAAIEKADPEETKFRAEVCIRGLHAMDAEATAAGHAPPNYHEANIDGFHFAIIPEPGDELAIQKERPGLRLYTMREIGLLLKSIEESETMQAAMKAFPNAELVAFRPHRAPLGEDHIPF